MSVKSNYIVYLDTSELTAHLALYSDGKKLAEERWEAGRELSKTLSSRFGELLSGAEIAGHDLSGICVFVGPGSFTGLRIGISFANGLAYGLSLPIYEAKERDSLDLSTPKKIALPFYGAEPKITTPKKK